ncbi:hypothetical protein F2P56_003746 [Juglans regia]|uniref:Uncharacterized mitochondrial protein AtMg00860-like n=2 Tax=Juglans regia TaxID=51240 RepID=A0A2I4H407_JUGRE|nr:uncharacterized mitochondrial protein AtMg00860-like [Juglans regia]KAF5477067.1 hypothetical protein F2P56_003746 [Juglans regia]
MANGDQLNNEGKVLGVNLVVQGQLFNVDIGDAETHLAHLKVTLDILRENQLFAKLSKCTFGCTRISYLGHLISGQEVWADIEKLKAMMQWPIPKSLKALRGFLGLTSYYKRFVCGYGAIAAKLTSLLKKDNFSWDEET